MENNLVLSVFSGIDLLGMGFKQNGFCVVSAGDIMTGSDIIDFNPTPNKFDGVIGGSPCQDFSVARRSPPTGYGLQMLKQFERIVIEANPQWFLLENVPSVPDLKIEGFQVQRFRLSPTDLGFEQNRPRHFQFGSKKGFIIQIDKVKFVGKKQSCLTASEGKKQNRRTFQDFLRLQGLPIDFSIEGFTKSHKYKLIGNGVHVGVANEISKKIRECAAMDNPPLLTDKNICGCGCGQVISKKATYYNSTCRKRMQKRRLTLKERSHCEYTRGEK